jgi:hypothetical protein
MTAFSFKQLQEEQKPWTKHNFGDRPSWMPLMGVIEEIGEMMEALIAEDEEAFQDGIADCIVFMSDFCIAMEFDFEEITNQHVEREFWGHGDRALAIFGARLSHSYLKKAQGIRGTPELHDRDMMQACTQIFKWLDKACSARGIDIEYLVGNVWEQVRKRDFKRFPKNGLNT